MDLNDLSSNWKKLQASGALKKSDKSPSHAKSRDKLVPKAQQSNASLKRKRVELQSTALGKKGLSPVTRVQKSMELQRKTGSLMMPTVESGSSTMENGGRATGDRVNEGLARNVDVGKYVALDCEMVGVGPHPHLESALARVSLVNFNGEQVYDSYVKPREEVTDWRTHVSGIQPMHMLHARSLEEVQTDVSLLIKGRIIVGHSIRGDFEALFLDHPKRDIRDTARHPPYRRLAGGGSPKLKILASELLGLDIQNGEHSSVEDARATMLLFRKDKDAFEKEHIKKWGPAVASKKIDGEAPDSEIARKSRKKKKKKR